MNANDKTIEQLEADAAEARKAIEALEAKKLELAKLEQKKAREAEELLKHKAATDATLKALSQMGPPLMKLAGELKDKFPALEWETVSTWSKYAHGEENRAAVEAAEKANPEQLISKIGERTVTILASPKKNVSGRWSGGPRLEVTGAVQLTISRGYLERPKAIRYKGWDVAGKMAKIISSELDAETSAQDRAKKRREVLDTIEFLAKGQFPKAEEVKAEYMYRQRTGIGGSGHGYVETDLVRLIVKGKKDDWNTRQEFENVLAVNGTLTCTKMMRVPVA